MTLERGIEYALRVGEGDTERNSASLLGSTLKSDWKPYPSDWAPRGCAAGGLDKEARKGSLCAN